MPMHSYIICQFLSKFHPNLILMVFSIYSLINPFQIPFCSKMVVCPSPGTPLIKICHIVNAASHHSHLHLASFKILLASLLVILSLPLLERFILLSPAYPHAPSGNPCNSSFKTIYIFNSAFQSHLYNMIIPNLHLIIRFKHFICSPPT